MLPWLNDKKRNDGGGSSTIHISNEGKISGHPHEEDMGLMSVAEDLCRAIESKDMKQVAASLRAAFQILDAEPHIEGPHEEE